ncbi:uncharacterized protein LODBEIA_P60200 [Lodderomyces beijingensis]|uniref:C2H2-type domain-containing protein n=1 Tax=Lodderomyces beijingensis TaxID=1775926 RepID=A0ABP0ZW52_9ASCO
MGRAEIGTAKYEAKKLKASGLQKLKFYCQICAKQCRDGNGFKNHLSSKSHMGRISNMEDSGEIKNVVSQYSREFEREFLSLLRLNHGTKPINANRFYQEYIRERDHVHMNVTRWRSLTSFVRYLGQNGAVRVTNTSGVDNDDHGDDNDEEGFSLNIQLVDHRSFLGDRRQDEEAEKADTDISDRIMQEQIRRGRESEAKMKTKAKAKKADSEPEIRAGGNEKTAADAAAAPTAPIRIAVKKKMTNAKARNAFDED